PSAPQSLTATVVGPKAVKLTWAAPSNSGSSEVKKYFVEDKTGTAAYAAAKIVSPSTTGKNSTASTSAIVTSLTTSNTYSFEVYAENAQSLNGTAAKSPATTTPVTAEPLTSSKVVPEAPTLVSLSTVNTAAVSAKNTEGNTIKWTAPAYPTTGLKYQVVRNGVVIADVTGTSYRDSTSPSGTASAGALATDSAPVAGTTYSYKVTAVSSTSDTATSASSKIDTGSAAPGAPTKLSATETATAGTVSLSWTAPVDLGASGSTHKYVVLENNAAPTGTVTFGKTGTTATVTGVSSTASTSFTVEAEDTTGAGASLGHSGPSNAASVIAKAASGDAAAPTGLTAGGTSPSTIKLTWNASSTDGYTAPTNYLVYGSTSSKSLVSTGNELAKIDTSTSYTATGLSSGTKYYFEIVASPHATTPTGSNVASASTTSTAAVSNVPGAPTALKATDDGALVNLSWTAPTSAGAGITGYEIFSTTTDSPSGAVALGSTSGTGTTAYIDNLTAGTPIYLWAEALSSVGHSALSAPVEITPSSSSARPAAPSTPEVTAFAGGADVVWTPPSSVGTSPIIGYFVTAHLVNGKGKTIRVNSGSATSAKVTGLEAGTYYFTVVAINAVGGGAASAPSSFVNVSAIPTKVFVTAPKAIVGPGNVTIRVTVNQPSAKVQLFDEAYKGTSFFSKAIMMTTPAKYGNGVAEFTVHIAASNKFYAMVNGVKSNVVTAMVSN
ncbi:MAG: fibronectin type III domain-containing protein, partial [Actinomycetota bacterium]|nr:fibronectin type III domain-containing protein [Actinomycetota bacterium]